MELSLDYIGTDDEAHHRESESSEFSEQDSTTIQEFIQNGPLKSDESGNVKSLEISPSMVNPNNCKISVSDFKVLNVIGRGGYGKVFLVQKSSPGLDCQKFYAMKVLKKAKIIRNEKDTAHTKSERNILEMIRHPFLVKLHYAFQNHSNLYIVLTFCSGGELFTYLEREGTLMENQACFYIAEISLAIGHLHSLGIIYRDLKPENVLLDKIGHVKLTDFGLSKESVSVTNTFCGTIEYMAPEILRRTGHGKEVDWWSLGTLLFDMLSGGPPFSQECDKEETLEKILHSPISYPKYFSSEVIKLINGLLRRNPKERLGSKNDVEDIKAHEFFKSHEINWNDVYARKMEPPFKPNLKSDTDVSCFDSNFTEQQPIMTPEEHNGVASHTNKTTTSTKSQTHHQQQQQLDIFTGFSYVAPNVASSVIGGDNNSYLPNRYYGGLRRASGSSNSGHLLGSGDNLNKTSSNTSLHSPLFIQTSQHHYDQSSPFLDESDFIDIASKSNAAPHTLTNNTTSTTFTATNKPISISASSTTSTTTSASSVSSSTSSPHHNNSTFHHHHQIHFNSHLQNSCFLQTNSNQMAANVSASSATSNKNGNSKSSNVSPSCPIPIPHRH